MIQRIVVLTDLFPSSASAIVAGQRLSQISTAEIHFVHISESEKSVADVSAVIHSVAPDFTSYKAHVGHGSFKDVIAAFLEKLRPDLIVVCSHGLHGISQHLFGSNIFKLLQSITGRFLVIHENTRAEHIQFKRLLLPASPFVDFSRKLQMALDVAEQFSGTITHFEIDKYLGNTEEAISQHRAEAESAASQRKIVLEKVLEAPNSMSMGFARQTIQYAVDNGFDAICITANAHEHNAPMGKADKEAFLTNDQGLPVLVYAAGERD